MVIMRVAFADITGPGFSFKIENDGWFPEQEIGLARGPEGSIVIRLNGPKSALVEGAMRVGVVAPCDRCCRQVVLDLTIDEFAYHCIVAEEEVDGRHDIESRKEDFDRLYLKEPVIDLGELMREQLFLALPSRILCRLSCQGLCPHCGADRNETPCRCGGDEPESPFSVLAQLKRR